jgi:hypothetical protein
MTAEEDAERRRRRRERRAKEEEERERRRAEEDREKKLREKIEKASVKAAAKAAAEEARKLVREKEDEKKRRRRRDSVVVRESENVPLRRVESEQAVEVGSPKLHRIPKVLIGTNGESVTRAGLLVRTSSDARRPSGESPRRTRRETQPTNSPLLYEASGSGKGERPRRSHRSGDKLRDRSDKPSSSQDAGPEGTGSRHSSRRHAESSSTPEEQRERPHRSRRESERRDRRPTVKEKEKKSSFFGSLMKAFK